MNPDARPVSIPGTTVCPLRSSTVGAEFELWVAEPAPRIELGPRGVETGAAEPAWTLYLLDAGLFFGTAVETTRLMHQLHGELPPIRVVGIAHATEDHRVLSEPRTRDFTPVPDPDFAVSGGAPAGRAEAFLAALEGEIRPTVEARWGCTRGDVLWGSSLGGLFVTHAFLTRPRPSPLSQRYSDRREARGGRSSGRRQGGAGGSIARRSQRPGAGGAALRVGGAGDARRRRNLPLAGPSVPD